MRNHQLPDLTFPALPRGSHEVPKDLQTFLYRGAAAARAVSVARDVGDGKFGEPILERLPLVKAIHAQLSANIAKGLSASSIHNRIRSLRAFYKWGDNNGRQMTLSTIESDYFVWIEWMLQAIRSNAGLKYSDAYRIASAVDCVLLEVLGLVLGLRRQTRLRAPKRNRRVFGARSGKQNLEEAFRFGSVLLDICDGLPTEVIRGPLPVQLHMRSGQVLTEWSKLRPVENIPSLQPGGSRKFRQRTLKKRAAWEADGSPRTRYPLINLRIDAELLIFISQTGMNLAQAHKLKRGQFRFRSSGEDLLVYRVYKNRRGGEAEFRVFKAYRSFLERYLSWLGELIPVCEDDRLFPYLYPGKIPAAGSPPTFRPIRVRCEQLDIRCVRPAELRKTRINWFLRRSGDVDQTADMAQHSRDVLLKNYEWPNHQLAAVEIARFHRKLDPTINPPGPGVCVGPLIPTPIPGIPPNAPQPNCVSPAGCLFCDFHRDIDSDDYAWSLASYRHLKSLELRRHIPQPGQALHPAELVVGRITAKLQHFRSSSEIRGVWVDEAENRVMEEAFHPAWDGFIQAMELRK